MYRPQFFWRKPPTDEARQIFTGQAEAGGMKVADICIEKPLPVDALRDIDLWTG